MSIFDRPSSVELLEAVIDFIKQEVKSDDYPANKRFKLQIVSNVLEIVKREVESGNEINKKFEKLGAQLLGEENFSLEVLSEKLRNNKIDITDSSLIDFLYELTEEKIKIDNPKYQK